MNNPNIIWHSKTFEELSKKELYQILQVRNKVFVLEQRCCYLDLDDSDQKALHLWATINGKIVAYARLFDKGIIYPEASIGRVLTLLEFRKKGLGKILMNYAFQVMVERFGACTIRIFAQDYLLDFYKSLGFQETDIKVKEDGIPHTEMIKYQL